MKVLLLGAGGQLGMALQRLAPAGVDLATPTREELDICNASQLREALSRFKPEVVINAAAYTEVDRAESEREKSFLVNAIAPGIVAESAASLGARMLQVSTDFVFSGDRPIPWERDAETAPVNVYGESKLAGERAVTRALGTGATVIRTSWLYGRYGKNFVMKMLDLMTTREQIDVVYDQVGTPTWANSLTEALWVLACRPEVHGIQHWCDDGVASWYDFAVAIQEEALARCLLRQRVSIRPIRSAMFPAPARRPGFSVLEKGGTAAMLGIVTHHWRENLRTMLDELAAA